MNKSESISKLADALVKAQAKIKKAHLDADNPFFNSKYATLEAVHDASHEALTENGLTVLQTPTMIGPEVSLETILLHSSGEFVSNTVMITPKDPRDPQKVGSSLTYYRRYSLAGILNLVQEDDDGNKGATPPASIPPKTTNVPAKVVLKTTPKVAPKTAPALPKLAADPAPIVDTGFKLTDLQRDGLASSARDLGWDDAKIAAEFKKLTGKVSSAKWTEADYRKVVAEIVRQIGEQALKDVPETVPSGGF